MPKLANTENIVDFKIRYEYFPCQFLYNSDTQRIQEDYSLVYNSSVVYCFRKIDQFTDADKDTLENK